MCLEPSPYLLWELFFFQRQYNIDNQVRENRYNLFKNDTHLISPAGSAKWKLLSFSGSKGGIPIMPNPLLIILRTKLISCAIKILTRKFLWGPSDIGSVQTKKYKICSGTK